MHSILSGIRVIDLTVNVLGPLATQILGDAGADVIKVEPPEGDTMRHVGPCRTAAMGSMFANLNRNKRSIVLDLKQASERALMHKLIAGADVFVHSLRPGAAARLELDPERLTGLNPRLIHASASGFRLGSSYQEQPSFDDTIQGLSGLAWLNRDAQGTPKFLPTVIADKLCGHVLANAIIMALLHRERTGEAQSVHVPMMDVMAAFTLSEHLWGATYCQPERGLGYTRLTSAHRKPYATQDGYICVMAVTDQQWARLFPAIGRDDLASDPRFVKLSERAKHIDEALGVLSDALRGRGTAEWTRIMHAADIPAAPVNSLADMLEDRYLAEAGFFEPVNHPTEGPMLNMRAPVDFAATPLGLTRLPPGLDQHGADLRAELAT